MNYLDFQSPAWLQVSIVAVLVFVLVRTRVHGALAFFLACCYSSLIVYIGRTTLVPVAFAALVLAGLLHLKNPRAFTFSQAWKPVLGSYLALIGWVLVRGWVGLHDLPVERRTLLFLLIFVNIIPVILADTLSWSDTAVQNFAKGFVAAVLVQIVVVWSRAVEAGVSWSSWQTDFWLTKWSSDETSGFVALTGITNYHWYSWNLGIAVLLVLFVLRRRESRHPWLKLSAVCVFTIACVQQVVIAGSRQSVVALVLAVLVTSWTRITKALMNVGAFVIVSAAVLVGLRVLANLEPLPAALMHGAGTVTEAFDPVLGRGQVWSDGLDAVLRSPLLGTGLASEDGFSLGHNIIINTLANFGVIGLAGLILLTTLYVTGPLRSAFPRGCTGSEMNRGLAGAQLFLVFTAMASGSVIASSGMFWLGAILVRRAAFAPQTRVAAACYQHRQLPA